MRKSRNVFTVAAVLVVVALIGLGIFQWQKSGDVPSPSEGPDTDTGETCLLYTSDAADDCCRV